MKVLVDIGHPAHVHFFRHPIALLTNRGHEVVVTSRDKEIAVALLDELGIEHQVISVQKRGGLIGLATELVQRNLALLKVVRRFRPQAMLAIGGTSIAHVGRLCGIPSLAFYDTENAVLQNAITYPFASCVVAPACYESWLPRRRHIRYRGYHELSYLHPGYFKPRRDIALANGVAPTTDTFFVRIVSWQASHDVGETGWNNDMLRRLIAKLSPHGKVLISSERPLGAEFDAWRYTGKVSDVHHVLAHCRALIGESATMASECAVLGIPSVYAALTGRGYTNEQEQRYGLVKNVRKLEWSAIETAIDAILADPISHYQAARSRLLGDTIDVAAFVAECAETFPTPLRAYQAQFTH
jgi:predicted glycosyltransferase